MTKIRWTVLLAILAVVLLAGCEQEGPAEQAGEEIDEAVESAGEKIEQAGDEIRERTQ